MTMKASEKLAGEWAKIHTWASKIQIGDIKPFSMMCGNTAL